MDGWLAGSLEAAISVMDTTLVFFFGLSSPPWHANAATTCSFYV